MRVCVCVVLLLVLKNAHSLRIENDTPHQALSRTIHERCCVVETAGEKCENKCTFNIKTHTNTRTQREHRRGVV